MGSKFGNLFSSSSNNKASSPLQMSHKYSPNLSKPKEHEPLDMFRSQPMTLLQLYIPSEAAQITVAQLGQLGLLQFRDVIAIWK